MTVTEQQTPETCPIRIYPPGGGYTFSRLCGRPLRTDDQRAAGLCGLHLAAKRKREANDRARTQRWARQQAAARDRRDLAAELREVSGLEFYHGTGIALSLGDARALRDRLADGRTSTLAMIRADPQVMRQLSDLAIHTGWSLAELTAAVAAALNQPGGAGS